MGRQVRRAECPDVCASGWKAWRPLLSLDASDWLTVHSARRTYGLPYYLADVRHEYRLGDYHFNSVRHASRDGRHCFSGAYRPVSPVYRAEPSSLEHWLTERYCLYTVASGGRLYRADMHHYPWALQKAEVSIEKNTILDGTNVMLPTENPPLLHYVEHLDILVWPPETLKAANETDAFL